MYISDFAFLVDVRVNLNSLNVQLKGKNKLITETFDDIMVFQFKL